MDENTIVITMPDGKEKEFKILFTFDHCEKSYVVFAPSSDSQEEFFVAGVKEQSDGSGILEEVEDEMVYEQAEELIAQYFSENESKCSCGCDGNDCNCNHDHSNKHDKKSCTCEKGKCEHLDK